MLRNTPQPVHTSLSKSDHPFMGTTNKSISKYSVHYIKHLKTHFPPGCTWSYQVEAPASQIAIWPFYWNSEWHISQGLWKPFENGIKFSYKLIFWIAFPKPVCMTHPPSRVQNLLTLLAILRLIGCHLSWQGLFYLHYNTAYNLNHLLYYNWKDT